MVQSSRLALMFPRFINSMTSIIQEFDNDGKNEVLLEKSPGLKNQ